MTPTDGPDSEAAAVHPGEAPGERGPLRILAQPEQLRVWANTRVRLRVEVVGDAEYSEFIWHFEDGSDPAAGLEVEHTFAESVRDRHVTVEARAPGRAPVIASRRLAVERLDVVPLDHAPEPTEEALPERAGTRVLFVAGGGEEGVLSAVAEAAGALQVDAVVVAADASDTTALDGVLAIRAPQAAVIAWSLEEPDAGAEPRPLLQVLRDPGGAVHEVKVGDKSLGVQAIRDLSLVATDTRGQTVAESELKRLRQALQAAGAYSTSLLLSARPLTQLTDGELIADRAYRLYEYALRQQITAVVSATSEVFYDGRFGGLAVVAVGRAGATECARLLGHEACQPASVTLVEMGDHKHLKVLHLLGPQFDRAANAADLPPEAGKVRR